MDTIASAIERLERAVERREGFGIGTNVVRHRLVLVGSDVRARPRSRRERTPPRAPNRGPRGGVGVGRTAQLRVGAAVPDRRRSSQLRRLSDVLRARRTRCARGHDDAGGIRRRRRDEDETRLDSDLPYASDDEALGAAFAGGPVALASSRFDDDARRSAYREYLASLADFAEGAGSRVPASSSSSRHGAPTREAPHRTGTTHIQT